MNATPMPWLERCRRFGETVIEPAYRTFDRENRFPDSIHAQAYTWRLINQDFPVELGGAGLDDVSAVQGAEVLARYCAPTAFTLGFNRGALHPVLVGGTEGQKRVFVADLLVRRGYAALCLTEPERSGSNVMELGTVAERTDRGWVISGTKAMVGNGGVAEQFVTLARAVDGDRSLGLTFFVVPRGEGVDVTANTDKLGFRAVETPTVVFRDVEISDDHRIGPVGGATPLLTETLSFIRVGGAAVILGLVVGALGDVLPWVNERQVYGGVLGQKTHVQLGLGDIYGRLLSTRELVHRAAALRRDGLPYANEASVAKLHSANLATEATAQISEWFGWRGVDADYAIQKRFRDARQTPIFEGTSDLQRLNLYRSLQAAHLSGGAI